MEMPTIKDKIYFNFDGRWSDEFGIINVVLDSNMYEDMFVANRSISETRIRGSNKPNFQGIEEEPIEFEMHLAFERKFSKDDIDKVVRWLFVDYYKPLYFQDSEDKVFYCMPVNDSRIIHNGLQEGYLTITMRCDSSNLYSPTSKTETFIVPNSGSIIVDIYNNGHFIVYPEISIYKNGNGIVVIESITDGGKIFEVRNLTNIEGIYIDCEREIIESDIIGINRYNDTQGEFPKLKYGKNSFRITGGCTISFRYRLKYRF